MIIEKSTISYADNYYKIKYTHYIDKTTDKKMMKGININELIKSATLIVKSDAVADHVCKIIDYVIREKIVFNVDSLMLDVVNDELRRGKKIKEEDMDILKSFVKDDDVYLFNRYLNGGYHCGHVDLLDDYVKKIKHAMPHIKYMHNALKDIKCSIRDGGFNGALHSITSIELHKDGSVIECEWQK